jgi:hypothetical protein
MATGKTGDHRGNGEGEQMVLIDSPSFVDFVTFCSNFFKSETDRTDGHEGHEADFEGHPSA